ncbi:hypothetical protein ACJX0J_040599, partial [Zea mays]
MTGEISMGELEFFHIPNQCLHASMTSAFRPRLDSECTTTMIYIMLSIYKWEPEEKNRTRFDYNKVGRASLQTWSLNYK